MTKKILLFTLVLILIGGVAFYWYSNIHITSKDSGPITVGESTTSVPSQTVEAVRTVMGWKSCSYSGFGFKVQYPKDWSTSFISNSQGGGAHVIKGNCGDIDARSILPEITFTSESDPNVGMKISILDKKGGFSDEEHARLNLQTTGATIYKGKEYTFTFSSGVSASTRKTILETFDLIP